MSLVGALFFPLVSAQTLIVADPHLFLSFQLQNPSSFLAWEAPGKRERWPRGMLSQSVKDSNGVEERKKKKRKEKNKKKKEKKKSCSYFHHLLESGLKRKDEQQWILGRSEWERNVIINEIR